MSSFNITVFASCGGGNFEYLVSQQKASNFKILKLICDRECKAIQKAINNNIPYELINKSKLGEKFHTELLKAIPKDTDLIVLAGFMPILPESFCQIYKNKIINTHPSLLPKYGGKGMYGVKVQEAVISNKEKWAGCTVHYVNAIIDGGDIISQKKIKVNKDETPWELGGRIFNEEGPLLVQAINKIRF